jgi:hypothetical protein
MENIEILGENLSTRIEEINNLYNELVHANPKYENTVSKSLILLLYAHYEGYINLLLRTYIQQINMKNVKRREVVEPIIVASMEDIFKEYENINKKSDIFKRDFPNEAHLHKYCRRIDLIEQINDFLEQTVKIPDSVINTESNLTVKILEKNCYKIGIQIILTDEEKRLINKLLAIRNEVAHTGSNRLLEDKEKIRDLKNKIIILMEDLESKVYEALSNKTYLKN